MAETCEMGSLTQLYAQISMYANISPATAQKKKQFLKNPESKQDCTSLGFPHKTAGFL